MAHIEYKIVQTQRIYFEDSQFDKVRGLVQKGISPLDLPTRMSNHTSLEIVYEKDSVIPNSYKFIK